jgi:hypothetical protein
LVSQAGDADFIFLGQYEWTKLGGPKLVYFQDFKDSEKNFGDHDANIPVVDAPCAATLVLSLQRN